MRIGFSPDLGGFAVDRRIAAVVAAAVRRFEEAGATVVQVDVRLPADQHELLRPLVPPHLALEHRHVRGVQGGRHGPPARPSRRLPAGLPALDRGGLPPVGDGVARDQVLRTAVLDAIEAAFTGIDLLVCPTVGAVQVPNADDGDTKGPTEIEGVTVDPLIGWCLTYVFNFTGHPAASIPAGLIDGRLPVGMQLVGRRGDDAGVLAASAVFERLRPLGPDLPAVRGSAPRLT